MMEKPVASTLLLAPSSLIIIFIHGSSPLITTDLFSLFSFLFLKIHVFSCRIHDAFAHVQLSDIRVIATLGVGGFGRVELVQISNDTSRSYGLKQMKKSQVEKLVITNGHLSCV